MRTVPIVALLLTACTSSPPPATTDGPTTATTSSSSTTAESTTQAPTTTTTGPVVPDMGPPCPVGALGCPCTQGGSCDPGLACEDGACALGCLVGSEGCACTQGGGCDGGLMCEAGTCVPEVGVSPPCVMGVPMDDCCGDGILDRFEECDVPSWQMGDDKACTSTCKMARCGDGLLYAQLQGGPEVDEPGDGCFDCLLESCGNGRVDPGEDCEPLGPGDVECAPTCLDARKIIFVTSEHYQGGAIGDVEGGDEKCQALADAAGLDGTFLAWLGQADDGSDYPINRGVHSVVPYFYTNGEQMAANWSEIYQHQGNLAPIYTELGTMVEDSELMYFVINPKPTYLVAWASGLYGPSTDCGDWSDTSAKGSAALLDHNPDYPGDISKWFVAGWPTAPCDKAAPIVCVEQ